MVVAAHAEILDQIIYSNEIVDINIINGILAADKDGISKQGEISFKKIATGEIEFKLGNEKASIVADQEIVKYLKSVQLQRSKNI